MSLYDVDRPVMVGDRAGWLLDRVPGWFRTRWPLRRYYWQPDQIADLHRRAQELVDRIGWK